MMTRHEYNAAMKKFSLPYGAVFFAAVIPGVIGTLYAADRIASVAAWPREGVFLAMLPVFLAPMLLGGFLMSVLDRRRGLRCHACGHSSSMGKHVRRLMRHGGACPKCGAVVVERPQNAEPSAGPNERERGHAS
jgi:hypothetical protein